MLLVVGKKFVTLEITMNNNRIIEKIKKFEKDIVEKIKSERPEIIESIESSGKLEENTEKLLSQIIEEHKKGNK